MSNLVYSSTCPKTMQNIAPDPWQSIYAFSPKNTRITREQLEEALGAGLDGKAFNLALQASGYWRVRLDPTQWRGPGMSVETNVASGKYGIESIRRALEAANIVVDE